jgi:hypothetical protein
LKLPTDDKILADLAKETLDQCLVDDLSKSDQILYTILQVQVGMALEAATMEQTA